MSTKDTIHTSEWVVWKYGLDLGDNAVELPRDHEWLSVAFQRGILFAWALVRPGSGAHVAKVKVLMTGHPEPERPRHFIGTAMTPDQSFVVHVWEDRSET